MMGEETAQDLWMRYRFLTLEMKKFLDKQDMEFFYELLDQRERLQIILNQTVDGGFRNSIEGKALFLQIQQDNQYIIEQMQLKMSISKRNHQVAKAYDDFNNDQIGGRNWKG